MIKCDMGIVSIDGNKRILNAELSTLIYVLKKDGILTDEEIYNAVEDALNITEEELVDSTEKLKKKLKKILGLLELED